MLNRKDIINLIHEDLELTKKDIEAVVLKFEEKIKESLANGLHVKLHGFGNFEIRDRAARSGRNPQTGEPIEISASQAPAFKPSSALKEVVKTADTQQ
jgi:DNA-binding protein HU-beta